MHSLKVHELQYEFDKMSLGVMPRHKCKICILKGNLRFLHFLFIYFFSCIILSTHSHTKLIYS